jgi:hypothetical protein
LGVLIRVGLGGVGHAAERNGLCILFVNFGRRLSLRTEGNHGAAAERHPGQKHATQEWALT